MDNIKMYCKGLQEGVNNIKMCPEILEQEGVDNIRIYFTVLQESVDNVKIYTKVL